MVLSCRIASLVLTRWKVSLILIILSILVILVHIGVIIFHWGKRVAVWCINILDRWQHWC